MSSSGVSGGAPGPWRVSGRVVLDASGAPVFRGWRVEKVGLTGRRFSVLADDGSAWSVRTIGVTVAQLLVEGPGGVLSLNRRAGSRDRDVVFLGDRPGSVDSSGESGFRRLTEWPVTSSCGTVSEPGEVRCTCSAVRVVSTSHSSRPPPNEMSTGASTRADTSFSARSDRYQRRPTSAAATSPTTINTRRISEQPQPHRPPWLPRPLRAPRPMSVSCRTRASGATVRLRRRPATRTLGA